MGDAQSTAEKRIVAELTDLVTGEFNPIGASLRAITHARANRFVRGSKETARVAGEIADRIWKSKLGRLEREGQGLVGQDSFYEGLFDSLSQIPEKERLHERYRYAAVALYEQQTE